MATMKELQAEIDALRAEVAALRAEISARPGWIQIVPAPTQPDYRYPYPYGGPTITCGTSSDNPVRLTLATNKGA